MSPTREIELDSSAGVRSTRVDPVTDTRWRDLVERSPSASIFHHPSWLGLLSDQYGYAVHASCVTTVEGELLAGLPLANIQSRITGSRLVSLPFSDVCEPLVAEPSGELSKALGAVLERERLESGLPLEIHAGVPDLPSGQVVESFYHHRLTLEPDADAVRRRFSKGARSAAGKARRADVKIERCTDPAALGTFYRLHMQTRRRQGVPTQPKRFITRFADLFAEDLGFVLVARIGGEPAAAAVFLTFNGVVTYKYGASEPRFLNQRPNNLLLWEAIQWGCDHGFRQFDFGRTALGNDGLRRFKHGWGSEEGLLSYTYAPDAPARQHTGWSEKVLKSTLQRSPPLASRLIGEVVYRHYG